MTLTQSTQANQATPGTQSTQSTQGTQGTQAENIVLHSTEGGSDKIYALQLVEADGGFLVNYQNGKRGGTMTNGTKTKTPVPFIAAKEIYDAKVKEQLKKHYKPIGGSAFGNEGNAGAANSVSEAYQAPLTTRTDSELRVQLLNAIEGTEAERLINDSGWVAEQKYDGERRPIQIKNGNAVGVNRLGYEVSLPMNIANEALALGRTFEIDGEIIGDRVYVFDVLSVDGKDLRGETLDKRIEARNDLLKGQSSARSAIQLVGTAYTAAEKRALVGRLRAAGQEGVVFKRLSSKYEPGRPASGGDQLKLKFWKSATVEVSGLNTLAGKKSFSVQVYDHGGGAIPLGNVTMLEPVQVGDIVEVRYLNANPGGALFQPTFLRKHADKTVNECQISFIEFKKQHNDVSQILVIRGEALSDDAATSKPRKIIKP